MHVLLTEIAIAVTLSIINTIGRYGRVRYAIHKAPLYLDRVLIHMAINIYVKLKIPT